MSTVKHLGWSLADQIVAGLSNVGFLLAAASVSTTGEFGVVSAATAAQAALMSISRAGLATTVSRSAGGGPTTVRGVAAHASGFLICLSPGLMTFVVGVVTVAGGHAFFGLTLLMGLAAPIVLLEDLLRFQASSSGRPRLALVADSGWLVVMAALIVGASLHGDAPSTLTMSAAWLAGAFTALGVLALGLKARPKVTGLRTWLKLQAPYLVGSMGGTTAVSASNVGRISLIGAARGPEAVGALAAGQLLMTPLNLLAALIPFAGTPIIARRSGGNRATTSYGAIAVASIMAGLGWWALCALVPDAVGHALLGEVWLPAQDLLAPMALLSIGVLVTASGMSLLLFLRRSRRFAGVSVAVALTSLAGTVVVLRMGGHVAELAWTQTAVVALGAICCWALALHANNESDHRMVSGKQSRATRSPSEDLAQRRRA